MSIASRPGATVARSVVALSVLFGTAVCSVPCVAAEVSLARVDAKLIKSFLSQPDLEVIENTTPQPTWDDPECREHRNFEVWQNQMHYATYSVWLCHSGVLGLEGFKTTVEESLQNLGHGEANQSERYKDAEGWGFEIDGRHGRTITVITAGQGTTAATALHFLPTAVIRSRDDTLNLAVATDDLQFGGGNHPTGIEALKIVEKILRAVDALTLAGASR